MYREKRSDYSVRCECRAAKTSRESVKDMNAHKQPLDQRWCPSTTTPMNHDITQKILEKIQSAHAADPKRVNGQAAEALYAERIEHWVERLVSDVDDVLRVAARCQHLERWVIPR